MILYEKLITEADTASIFDPAQYRDEEYEKKLQSRIRALHRAMDQAERAAELAEKQGNPDRAKEFTDRVQELQALIDLQEREEEQAGIGQPKSSDDVDSSDESESEETDDIENDDIDDDSDEESDDDTSDSTGTSDDSDKSGTGGDGDSDDDESEDKNNDTESDSTSDDSSEEDKTTTSSEDSDRGDTKASSHGETGEGNDESKQDSNGASSDSDSSSSDSEDSDSDSNDGEITDSEDDSGDTEAEINPFELNPNATFGNGKMIKPKDPSIATIIKILKRLEGDGRSGAKKALHDILVKRGIDPTLFEAFKPLPGKTLMDLSDEEFNDIINNTLDEVDKVTPLPFENPDERKKRLQKIQTDSSNAFANRELEVEDNVNLQQDRAILRAREQEKQKFSNFKSIDQFKINFWRAIKDQVEKYEETEETPTRINRQYDGEDIIKNGERTEDRWSEDKPSIDLYFDMSGSWTGNQTAIDIGKAAVKTIKDFEDAGDIILNVYYFSNSVVNSMDDPSLGGGTGAWKDILQHIKANHTKNVVLMTDSDMDYDARGGSTCVVDGCVWLIWRDGDYSEAIAKHLIGKQGTNQYSFVTADN